jgi:hypothetical protein
MQNTLASLGEDVHNMGEVPLALRAGVLHARLVADAAEDIVASLDNRVPRPSPTTDDKPRAVLSTSQPQIKGK